MTAGVELLEVTFADVSGAALCWALDLPPRPGLAAREVRLDHGLAVELRVLGASHQVLVRRDDEVLLTETVACDLGTAGMPATTSRGGYDFASEVQHLDGAGLQAEVDALTALGDRPDALVAAFPGTPYAVTAVALERTGHHVAWRTWHAYPQTGELVRTRTRLDLTTLDDGRTSS